jgi:hypothetical protein
VGFLQELTLPPFRHCVPCHPSVASGVPVRHVGALPSIRAGRIRMPVLVGPVASLSRNGFLIGVCTVPSTDHVATLPACDGRRQTLTIALLPGTIVRSPVAASVRGPAVGSRFGGRGESMCASAAQPLRSEVTGARGRWRQPECRARQIKELGNSSHHASTVRRNGGPHV